MKRKLIAILTAAVFMLAFAACGQEEQTEETAQATEATETTQEAGDEMQHTLIINSEPYSITADSCDSRGFNYVITDADARLSFKSVNESNQDVSWTVYLMDRKFEDETKYIGESQSPALEGDGTLDVKEGQYIYVCCSANEFSGDSGTVPEDAWLEINYAE